MKCWGGGSAGKPALHREQIDLRHNPEHKTCVSTIHPIRSYQIYILTHKMISAIRVPRRSWWQRKEQLAGLQETTLFVSEDQVVPAMRQPISHR